MELTVLCIFVIAAALTAVEAENMLTMLASFGAAGFGFALMLISLNAPEAAFAQFTVELVVLAALIWSTGNAPEAEAGEHRGLGSLAFTLIFAVIFLIPAYYSLKYMNFAQNNYSAFVLGSREFDVVASSVALVAAALGAMAVLRSSGRKGVSDK